MRAAKLFFKKTFILLFILTISFTLGLFYFFKSKDAPILKGEVIHHIKYKKDLTLDLYLPTNKVYSKSPVILFIHGGAWMVGRKETINLNRFHGAINKLRDKGYAVVSPEYTLAQNGHSPFPNCINDGIDALQWIKNNAENYTFDLNNIGVFGESAGAQIAMMTALAQGKGFHDTKLKAQYIVDIYGPNNLDALYHMPLVDSAYKMLESVPASFRSNFDITKHLFGFDPKVDPEKTKLFMEKYSPIRYTDENCPPVLIIHGKNDQVVPVSQSLDFQHLLDSIGIQNEIHLLDSVDHTFRGITETQRSEVQDWVIDFIERNYQK
ncbi:alpha/beta hydrolase [Sediminitomix flava]|uniref:Acetyl esterase/lipase n=1 Tax=Sediminitomix flava TaxID=379075 RepID=A0A315ZB76_SEDFL|nr:alpha/beta hydrolase [Sediminitomix flava]PWJ42610.1 acetyl esterase/lipase [Sediminitomix flava]